MTPPILEDLLEDLKADLITELEAWNTATLADCLALASEIDGVLGSFIVHFVTNTLHQVCAGSVVLSPHRIQIDGRLFQVQSDQAGPSSNSLVIEVTPFLSVRSAPSHFGVLPIAGSGRFRDVSVIVPKELEPVCTAFPEVTRVVFQTGYLWLQQQIQNKMSDPRFKPAQELYDYMKVMIGDRSELLQAFTFNIVQDNSISFLLNDDLNRFALDRLTEVCGQSGGNALEQLAVFGSFNLPVGESFTKQVMSTDSPNVFDLNDSRHHTDKLDLVRAEQIVLDTDLLVIFPIANHGSLRLVAAFPGHNAEKLAQILTRHRGALEKKFNANRDAIGTLVHRIRRDGIGPGNPILKISAEWTAEFIKNMLKPG